MTPKTNPNHCDPGLCDEHSGMVVRDNDLMMWLKGTFALMAASSALLGYSVLWQAPNIRIDIAKEIARLDAADRATCNDVKNMQKDITSIDRRVSVLEASK